jgi:S-methylmethionine-dependent homocysteine/selenocysteine methylase
MQGPATPDVVRALSERTFLTFAGDETYLLYIQRDYRLTIVGGCCGTDAEHLARIASTCR